MAYTAYTFLMKNGFLISIMEKKHPTQAYTPTFGRAKPGYERGLSPFCGSKRGDTH